MGRRSASRLAWAASQRLAALRSQSCFSAPSWGAMNSGIMVCALRFYYGVTLGQANLPERIPHAREPRKLPVVLSADEVVRFLEAVAGLKHRAALTTAYAAGLRASEVASLKVADIDSSRMV